MADNDEARARVDQHRGADAAGVRAFLGKVDVLGADREAGNGPGGPLDQGCRNAQRDIDRRKSPRGVGDRPHLLEVGRDPVHLPIPGHELVHAASTSHLGRGAEATAP